MEKNRRREREELTYTDPFVSINALYSLKGYLTWQVEKEHILTYRNGVEQWLQRRHEMNVMGPKGGKQVKAAAKKKEVWRACSMQEYSSDQMIR